MDPTIWVALIAALASIATVLIQQHQRRQVAEVKAQVKNGHASPLRDDIDQVLNKLDDLVHGQTRHDAEIAGIRQDLRMDRKALLLLEEEVYGRNRA